MVASALTVLLLLSAWTGQVNILATPTAIPPVAGCGQAEWALTATGNPPEAVPSRRSVPLGPAIHGPFPAGVQFLLDGQPIGSVMTEAPTSLAWMTSTSSDGPHRISAILVAADPRCRELVGRLDAALEIRNLSWWRRLFSW